jgi:uncharacterized protein (TIGR00369 family)
MADTTDRTQIEPAIWREPVRGAYPDLKVMGLSGLEQLRRFIRLQGPKPPIHYLTGMRPTEIGPGTSTFTMPVTPWLISPPGYVQLGTLTVLADGPLGCAVQATLPPMTAYTTAEISMNHIRPVTPENGQLVARGRVVFGGRSLGLSEVIIEDQEGRVVAHGTSRCFIFPPFGPPPPEPPEIDSVEDAVYDTPDPYLRPAAGDALGQDVYDRLSGLEIMEAHMARDLPAPPISHLTGLRPTAAADGSAEFVLPASEWLCSPLGKVEGGFIALLADTVIATAVQTTLPARSSYAPLDLKVNFLRPVNPDGRDLVGRASVVHRGGTIQIAHAELFDADEKRVAVATGTYMILPGRPWFPDRSVELSDEPPASKDTNSD